MITQVRVQCPAKINLTLKVTGKRPDGYHNIESIMQTINLYDYLNISIKPAERLEVNLAGENKEIPYDENNLVHKAAVLFFESIGEYKNYKVDVFIEKNIPVSAGLAGGSSNAAGMLLGLNRLLNSPLSAENLNNLCARLGSDLNFCLSGGCCMTSGRGEIITPLPYEEKSISLIKPISFGISAKEAYTKFSQKSDEGKSGREKFLNDLEWAVIGDYAELQLIKKLYPESVMSGSGPVYYMINKYFSQEEGFWICNCLKTTPSGAAVL